MKWTKVKVKVKDIAEISYGYTAKASFEKGSHKFLRITDIQNNTVNWDSVPFCDVETSKEEKFLLSDKDIVFARTGATTGKSYLVRKPKSAVFASYLIRVRLISEGALPEFIALFFQSDEYWDQIGLGIAGAAQGGFNASKLGELELSLPPLSVQKQIVEKLDAAFADIDRAISATEKIISTNKVLLESFSNKYMFENRNNFKTASIGDLFDLSTGGTPSKKKSEYFTDGEIPWLVSGDIHQQEIIDCEGRITEEGYKNSNAKFLPIDSVLIALNGQGKTRGTVAMLRIKATCNQSLVSIYPKNSKTILPEYLYFNLKNRYSEIRKITGGSGNDRRGLNMTLIKKIPFSYAEDIEEQSKYIEKSKNLITHIDHLNVSNEKKLIELNNLKGSILKQVFSGEFTKDAA